VNARIDNFALTDLNPIIPQLPVNLENGFLAGNLNIELPSFTELPTVLGTLGFRDIAVNGSQLPEKVLANGLLRFQGKKVKLEDIQGSVGAIAAEVSGQVDLDRGFDVAVDVNPFALNNLLEIVGVWSPNPLVGSPNPLVGSPNPLSPVLLDGDMAVNLQVTGPLQNPQVAGTVGTIGTTQIDAIAFTDIRADFSANLQQFTLTELRILPLAGGEITGSGEVKLNQASPKDISLKDIQLAFDFGVQLPVDDIAAALKKPGFWPAELAIGTLSATAKIRGTADNPEANLNWRLPAAEVTIPNPNNSLALGLSGFGEVILRDRIVRLRNTLLKLGDGSITLAGNGNLETKKWQASVAAASFTLDPFLPVPIKVAIQDANAKADGSLDKPDPKDISASGQVGINIEGGTVTGEGRLDNGNVEASATLSQIELNQLGAPVPLTLLAGNVKLSGSLDALDSAVISANLGLKVADGLVDFQGEVKSGFVNVAVNTSAIDLTAINLGGHGGAAPTVQPGFLRILGSQVNLAASIDSLMAAATSAGTTTEKLPTPESLSGIDVNADIQLAIADGLVNAKTQLNSGLINASVTTTDINLADYTEKPGFLSAVRLLGSEVNATASLVDLINAANSSLSAIARNQLPTAESLSGIDVNADVRLGVADGLVNAKTELNSGVINASVNTTEINLADYIEKPGFSEKPGFLSAVRLLGSEVNATASLADLINVANSSLSAIARNQLPTAESLSGIDVNADIRLGVADGLVNAKTQLNSGLVKASVNTTEINLADYIEKPGFSEKPGFLSAVRLLGSEVNATASLADLINVANSSLSAIARNQLPPAENLTGIDLNADVRLGVADGLVDAKTQLSSGVVNASVNTTEINLASIAPDLPVPVRLFRSEVNANASLANLINVANQASQGGLTPENLPNLVSGIDVNADVRLGVADGRVNAKTQLSSGVVNASVNTTEINLGLLAQKPGFLSAVRLLGSQINANASLADLINVANNSLDAISRNQLPPAENLTGIDVNADIRLGVADGRVNAKTQLSSGVVNASVNTSEINLGGHGGAAPTIIPNLPVPVRLLASQINANASLADLINVANSSLSAISLNESSPTVGAIPPWLPPPESLTGIDVNADVRLAVADGVINTTAQLNSGEVKVRGNAAEINVGRFAKKPGFLEKPGFWIEAIQFNLATSLASLFALPQTLDFSPIEANVNLDLLVADGRVNARSRLNSGLLSARANTSGKIYIPELSPQLPIPVTLYESAVNVSTALEPLISLAQNAAGQSIQELSLKTLEAVEVNGNLDLAIAEGRVQAEATVKKNQWQTAIDIADIQLLQLLEETRFLAETGFLQERETQLLEENGFFATASLTGELAPLLSLGAEPVAIQAKNLSAQLGDHSLAAKGSIALTNLITTPDVSQLQLDLVARSNLATLPVTLPPEMIAKGLVDLNGRLEGKNLLSNPLEPGNVKFTGDLRLANVAVNDWELDPMLSGPVNVETGNEIAIALKGKRDILAAQLEPCDRQDCLAPYLPVSLDIQLGAAGENPIIATGTRKGDRFDINLEKFSLTAFQLSPGIEYGIPGMVGGDISANLGINLFTLDADGSLQVIKPSFGYIQAEEFTTNLAYTNGVGRGNPSVVAPSVVDLSQGSLKVSQGSLKVGKSQYEFEGGVNLNTRQINGQITTNTAYVEDILTTFSWYSFQDLARNIQAPNTDSSNLETQPRGLPNEPLLTQLRRFAEINARLQQNAELAKLPAPPSIADIRGRYNADITIAGTLENPLVDLNVEANDLEWRTKPPYTEVTEAGLRLADNQILPIDRVIVQGNFENGVLTVQPMRVEFGDTLISFVGKFGEESNSGKFEMEKLSIDTIRNFVDIPGIKLDGNINANAVLAGTITNPQLRGDISLTEGQINNEAVDEVFGTFSLSNQRLLFATTQPSSLQVFGSAPVPPIPGENEQVSLKANIGTEAIALLGTLTQGQIEWLSGEGEIQVSAQGNIDLENKTLKNLEATGAMTFQDATLKTATLDEALLLNGEITFDQERIRVDQFAGVFADSILTVHGVLPLLAPLSSDDPDVTHPMTISLNEGDINLEKLYQGKVGGEVIISGSAFRPVISGGVRLEDGTAFVPKRDESQGTRLVMEEEPPIVPILDQFTVELGDDFTLENWPLFKFKIMGQLIVNGSLYDLKPDGIIRLGRGEINLFSSNFYVTRNYDQLVTFYPEWGLDPELNIQLGTVVLEKSDQQRLPDSDSEILDPLVFSSRPDQINVRLTIKGRSTELLAALDSNSQLLDLVEITSTPARNESEIVSLLGREFLATLEELQRLPGDLQDRSSRQLLELAINSFILKPYLQELQFAVEDVVTKAGQEIGLEDLRVYPTFEGLYQLDERSTLGLSYDYTYQQVEVRYEIRF
jgi:translocation and assembly module TamB